MFRTKHFLIFLLVFHFQVIQSQNETVIWQQVGDSQFPTLDSLWYRAKGVCGIGQIRSISTDPNNAQHLVIGTVGGGVWETYNALNENSSSVHWVSLTDSIPAYMIPKVILHKGNIYASTTSNISTKYTSSLQMKYGLGIIKKNLNNTTWSISNTKFSAGDFDLIEKNAKVTLYATAYNSQDLYKSNDDGKTWGKLTSINAQITEKNLTLGRVFIHPNNPNIVYLLANGNTQLLFKTTDGGNTWQDSTSVITDLINYDFITKGASLEGYINPDNQSLHLAIHSRSKLFIIHSSDWQNFELYNKDNKRGIYVSVMRNTNLLQLNPETYLFGATQLHLIENGKSSSNISRNRIHDDIRAVKSVYTTDTNEKVVYIGTDGGIFYTKDLGKTFVNISGNLQLFQCASMAYNRQDGHRIITIGVQDGTWYRIDRDGNNRWDLIETCCEGAVYTQPDDSDTVYFVKNGTLHRSINGLEVNPKNHTIKTKKIDRIEDLDAPMAIDPNNTSTIVYGKYVWPNSRLKISYDKGEHSAAIGFKDRDYKMFGRPSAMGFCQSDSNVFYMTSIHFETNPKGGFFTKTYIHKSTNMQDNADSIHFINLTENMRQCDSEVLDDEPITDLYIHPENPDRVWISFGNLLEGKKVFSSNDGGETWKNISYNLPNVPVNDIIFELRTKSVFIGSDIGVYKLTGEVWKRFGSGLPIAIISDLELDTVSNELIACTFGKSVWTAKLGDSCDDVIITKKTTWKTDKKICGTIIIKNGARLKIKRANIHAKCLDIQDGKLKLRRKGKLHLSCKN